MSYLQEFRDIIANSGYKPYVLSTKLGYNPSNIYHWLDGTNEPCCRDILKMSELLNCPVETLVRIFASRNNVWRGGPRKKK